MASSCRAALVCLAVIMVCVVFPRVQADLMETSTAHDIKITVSKQESETEKNFHVENVTSADFSELSPRQDDPDAVEQPEEKPKGKAKQDPYTKSVLGALDSMRTDFTNLNLGEFMKVVNDKKLLKKPATTTSKPVQVADGQQGAVPVKATAAPAQVNGDNGQDGAVQVPETVDEGRDTQETVDGPQPENAGSPYTKNLMTELDSMHRGSLKFDLGKLFTAINKDKEFQKGSTVKRTIDNGGNSTSDCACKTSSGVCHPVDAKQCLLHNGARIVKCEASGKWMPVEECKKTCEWSAGKLPVCVN